MTTLREMAPHYVRQYRRARDPLGAAYDPDAGEEVLAALCNRAALEEVAEVQAELAAEDVAFAEALSGSSDEWQAHTSSWALSCRFDSSPWWKVIQGRARGLRVEAGSPTDRLGKAVKAPRKLGQQQRAIRR